MQTCNMAGTPSRSDGTAVRSKKYCSFLKKIRFLPHLHARGLALPVTKKDKYFRPEGEADGKPGGNVSMSDG
jgi:hypothetical protein